MAGVTYDTGALIAAERNDRRMWALHAAFLAEEVVPVVPAPVLAEAWRGGPRQASLARLLAMCDVEEMSVQQAQDVGVLAGKADHDDIVDVTVVEGAARRGDAVVTADRSHIEKNRGGGRQEDPRRRRLTAGGSVIDPAIRDARGPGFGDGCRR